MTHIFVFALWTIISFCSFCHGDNSLPAIGSRILAGTTTTNQAERNSLASIRFSSLQGQFHICGGFIINKRWVGTAAQCLTGQTIQNTVVAVGSPATIWTIATGTIYELSQIETHQNYNELTLANDIAVLKTAKEIIITTNVKPIPLGTNLPAPNVANTVAIYGWGRTLADSNLSSNLLRRTLAVLTRENCLTKFPFVARRFITDRHICLESAGGATCPGDAGGPIYFNSTVIGIISWVEPCVAGQTNVNTRIGFYANWILNITRADD